MLKTGKTATANARLNRLHPKKATLDLKASELNDAFEQAVAFAGNYFNSVNRWRVFPKVDGQSLRQIIREKLPRKALSPKKVIDRLAKIVLSNSRHNLHPRFFGYVSSSGNPVGAIADLLISILNQNVTAWRSAPAAVEIELQAIDWIKEVLGYPKTGFGMFVSGGSMATLQALTMAREIKSGKSLFRQGVQSLGRKRLVLFMSSEGHMSIPKAMGVLGLGKSAVRTAGVDEKFKIDLEDLQEQITLSRKEGHIPFCVVGNAGTVNTGAIDDLEGIARICRRENLWFHVDGAYGGFAALSPSARRRFRGIERADSVSLDPHKWLYQPLDAGCVLIKNRVLARQTFGGSGAYAKVIAGLPGEDFAFFEHGIELSRRFRALKIWMALKCYGKDQLAACVEKNLEMAQALRGFILENDRLELHAPVELSIVCFRYVPRGLSVQKGREATQKAIDSKLDALNEAIMFQLQRGGVAYVSNAVLHGRFVLRACILSYRTEKHDLEILVREVLRLGQSLEKQFFKK